MYILLLNIPIDPLFRFVWQRFGQQLAVEIRGKFVRVSPLSFSLMPPSRVYSCASCRPTEYAAIHQRLKIHAQFQFHQQIKNAECYIKSFPEKKDNREHKHKLRVCPLSRREILSLVRADATRKE